MNFDKIQIKNKDEVESLVDSSFAYSLRASVQYKSSSTTANRKTRAWTTLDGSASKPGTRNKTRAGAIDQLCE